MVAPLSTATEMLGAISAGNSYSRESDAADRFDPDKKVIRKERSDLTGRYGGRYAARKVPKHENFDLWTHQQIWDALHGAGSTVSITEINDGADGWRRLDEGGHRSRHGGMRAAVDVFRADVDRALETHWSGKAATAAMAGTKAYVGEAAKLAVTFQLMANCIDLLEGALGQSAAAVTDPGDVSGFDQAGEKIPTIGFVKQSKHDADEAQAEARRVMREVYQPAAKEVDDHTPVLAQAVSTFQSGSTVKPGDIPATKCAGPPAPEPEPAKPPVDGKDIKQRQNKRDDNDETGTDAADTTPSSTSPSTNAPTATTPSTPGGAVPGSGVPGNGSPGNGLSGGGVPIVGKAAPGTSGQPTTSAAARGANTSTGRNGMPGMGGMGAPGARGRGEDDDEHTSPEYLVRDRTTELLGEQPWVLPTGGVIE